MCQWVRSWGLSSDAGFQSGFAAQSASACHDLLMDQDDPEKRVADLERRLAEQRSMAQPEPRQPGAVPPPGLTVEDVRNVAFSDAAVGERGYNHDEVDAFLDHIAPALQGQTGRTFTAECVRSIRFTQQPRGYAVADVDAFVERVDSELDRRAGRQPMAYPGAGGSQPRHTTAAVPQPAVSGEPGFENRTESRRRGLGVSALGWGLVNVVIEMVTPPRADDPGPRWVTVAWGVILVVMGVIGVVTGKTGGHFWFGLWFGIAMLAVMVLYLGFKLIRKLVPKPQPRDDQSPPGRHSAG
jgi:DivIVA domain-containing protein